MENDNIKYGKLANKFGTPLYVYDAKIIRKSYQELKSAFSYPKIKLFYAMKANYNPAILKILLEEGANIDAVSPAEVILAQKVGFTPERILYTANMMTDAEMHEVHNLGVLFNIGSLSELERYGKFFPGTKVCIRFNPDVVAGHHEKVRTGGKDTKFGIILDKVKEVKEICQKYNLTITGVHEHTGSGIPETVDMMSGLRNVLNIITPENFPALEFLDFGGGFKVNYHEDEKELDYNIFGEKVAALLKETNDKFGKELEMYFEPGRFLVATSGKLLVQVTTLKENEEKRIVGTNSGFPQLIRPMFYDAYHEIKNLTHPNGEEKVYDVAGNICETGDYFATERLLPEIREGDILIIETAGAYCYSMGGVYNLRAMPPEILIDGDNVKVVSKRKSNEELAQEIVSKMS